MTFTLDFSYVLVPKGGVESYNSIHGLQLPPGGVRTRLVLGDKSDVGDIARKDDAS